MLKVITVTNQPDRAMPLINSLEKFKWHTELLVTEWKGFGTKLITVYEFLKAHPEVDRFIFCDAHDVLVLGTREEFENKLEEPQQMLVSAERGLWPGNMEQYRNYYEPVLDHGYNFVNSGLYYSPADVFIEIMDRDMPKYESDDQEWLGMNFLFNDSQVINMDRDCNVFQSYSFIQEYDYEYRFAHRVFNKKTETQPIFIHGNGQTDMTKIYDLLK